MRLRFVGEAQNNDDLRGTAFFDRRVCSHRPAVRPHGTGHAVVAAQRYLPGHDQWDRRALAQMKMRIDFAAENATKSHSFITQNRP